MFELLIAHGEGKPVLIFCPTRKIVESCAEQLFKDIEQAGDRKGRLPWKTSKALLGSFTDKKLQSVSLSSAAFESGQCADSSSPRSRRAGLAAKGIAFHHAGLSVRPSSTCGRGL